MSKYGQQIVSSKQELLDCIKNLMGIIDNPVGRRKLGNSEFIKEAVNNGREILEREKPKV